MSTCEPLNSNDRSKADEAKSSQVPCAASHSSLARLPPSPRIHPRGGGIWLTVCAQKRENTADAVSSGATPSAASKQPLYLLDSLPLSLSLSHCLGGVAESADAPTHRAIKALLKLLVVVLQLSHLPP